MAKTKKKLPSEARQRDIADVVTANADKGTVSHGRRIRLGQHMNGKWYLDILTIRKDSNPDYTWANDWRESSHGSKRLPIDPDTIDALMDALIMVKALIADGKNLEDA